MPTDFNIVDDEQETPELPNEEDRLNLNRIHAIALEKRAAYRRLFWARSIVFAFACLCLMTAVDAARVEGRTRLWFIAAACGFAILTARAWTRLRKFKPSQSNLAEGPTDLNAFRTLSDGKQLARHLDELNPPHR